MSGWRGWIPGFKQNSRSSPIRNGSEHNFKDFDGGARSSANYLSLEGLHQKYIILQEINQKYLLESSNDSINSNNKWDPNRSTQTDRTNKSTEKLNKSTGSITSPSRAGPNEQKIKSDIIKLVDTLRAIAEILIWGDQNDGTVFEHFLEKNIFSEFLAVLQLNFDSPQKTEDVSIQLLQTLNILFENLKNDTSFYFLLSNNHVNEIINHEFEFDNEEVLAYYISFLKTLSLRLNENTIHFFFNEHSNNYPLYTAALKFSNHSEFMVKIASRTITLNVFRLKCEAATEYICNDTAEQFFQELIDQILVIYRKLETRPSNKDEAVNLLEEHQELLQYANDILYSDCDRLKEMLETALTSDLIEKHYLNFDDKPQVQIILLSHTLFTIPSIKAHVIPSLDISKLREHLVLKCDEVAVSAALILFRLLVDEDELIYGKTFGENTDSAALFNPNKLSSEKLNYDKPSSDKLKPSQSEISLNNPETSIISPSTTESSISTRLPSSASSCSLNQPTINNLNSKPEPSAQTLITPGFIDTLLNIVGESLKIDTVIRSITVFQAVEILKLEKCRKLLKNRSAKLEIYLKDLQSTLRLHFRRDKDNFADVFHQELYFYHIKRQTFKRKSGVKIHQEQVIGSDQDTLALDSMRKKWSNLENLLSDGSIVYNFDAASSSSTNSSSVNSSSASCAEKRHVVMIYFLIQDLMYSESCLPLPDLFKVQSIGVSKGSKINLDNSDLASCYLNGKRKFMVIKEGFVLLVDPDPMKLGWAIIRRVFSLARVELKQLDAKSLLLILSNKNAVKFVKDSNDTFVFEDHIRCSAVRARLLRGRDLLLRDRQKWLSGIIGLNSNQNNSNNSSQLFNDADSDNHISTPGRAVKSKTKRGSSEADPSGIYTI